MRPLAVLVVAVLPLLACTGLFGGDTGESGGDCPDISWFRDVDGDGFGSHGDGSHACAQPKGYVDNTGDCDDEDPDAYPGGVEVCDRVDADEDCDGKADEADDSVALSSFYGDTDGDGYGDAAALSEACEPPAGSSENADDCDDTSALIHPGATEICDPGGEDEDCDGLVNDDDDSMSTSGLSRFYPDNDGDGYGDSTAVFACDPSEGFSTQTGDCDDNATEANPGAVEICNDGLDNNCNGEEDGCGFTGTVTAASGDVTLRGSDASGAFGSALRSAGDLNGDGNLDILAGAPYAGITGTAYVFYGPLTGVKSASAADVAIAGTSANTYFALDVEGGYDWNDDGYDDVAVADAYGGSGSPGYVYLFYGPLPTDLRESDADWALTGASGDQLGHDLLGGDWDGDGNADLATPNADASASLYIHLGPLGTGAASPTNADVSITGIYEFGDAAFGDADGDGADDLLVSATYADSYAGYTYFIEGGTSSGALSASTADTATFKGNSDDQAGGSVTFCDLDGDGHPEAVIGVQYSNEGGLSDGGSVYSFRYPYSGDTRVADATGQIDDTAMTDYFGTTVACMGDMNLDGKDDLGVTASYGDSVGTNSGTGYLFYGDIAGSMTTTAADATIKGDAAGDYLFEVAGLGDVTGDAIPDVVFGAPYNDDGGSDAGGAWVFTGGGY